mmetsp:Transcript_30434/g.36165  ORF Transcript_30434/g.36165 Transcript_30434/m.36165 type:complete len:498 (-) Transcript_30434:28-1521(-)
MQSVGSSANIYRYISSRNEGKNLLLLLLLLTTNAIPTSASSSSSSSLLSSRFHQQRATVSTKDSIATETTADVLDLTCDVSAPFWGLSCRSNNRLLDTKIAGRMNLSALLRPTSSSLLSSSSPLPYMKRIRTSRSSSLNGIIDSIRGGGTDDEEEYDDEDVTDSDSEEVSDDEDDESSDDDEEKDEEESDSGDTDSDEEEEDGLREQSSDGEHDTEYDEYDEDEESEYEEDEESEYAEDEDVGAMASSIATSRKRGTEQAYDEPLALSSIQDMGVTLGVMVLCNKLDLTNTRIIKFARFTFIAYVILTQLFLIYARHQAHKINDRTPISISNPLSNMIKSQLGSASKGDMIKNVANSILSSESTIMEYDLSQAKNMNNGLFFPMVMLYFLHFKMGQVQPLFYQTANGIKGLLTSPLFQVYVLGKNLERPFKNPQMEKMTGEQDTEAPELGEGIDTDSNQEEEDSDVEDIEESDDSDSDSEDFDSDEDSEYDAEDEDE